MTGEALIADAQPTRVDLAGRLMRRLGYPVTTAVDGVDALDATRRDPPDIVLLDVEVPHLGAFIDQGRSGRLDGAAVPNGDLLSAAAVMRH